MTQRIFAGCILVLIARGMLAAQVATEQTFDAVSIRRNLSGSGENNGPQPGRYVVRNAPVASLIMGAYQFLPERVFGLPEWTRNERYDIDATLPAGVRDLEAGYLHTMLRDRFGLRVHTETRPLPVYLLVPARADGAPGPGLRRSPPVDCANEDEVKAARAAQPNRTICSGSVSRERMRMFGRTLDSIANALTTATGRPVINRTGMPGRFDVELEWSYGPDAGDRPSIFTVVQEELGLRLVSDTAPIEVLVVDRVERPSEN